MQDFNDLRENGLDVDAALRYTGGEDKYIVGLNRFYNAYEKNSNRIKNSYDSKNYEDYTIIVHSLKSNARMIGDNELGDLAEKLQYAGEDRDIELIDAETEHLLIMYKDLVNLIKPYVNEDSTDGLDKDAAIKIANELIEKLEDYDYEDSIILHKKLAEYKFKPQDRVIYNDIKDEIEKFQYDEACELVGELIEHIS